jgi:hypothetical protein
MMRAPSDKRSTDKRIDDKAAIEEASRRLGRLFGDIVTWSERGAGTSSPEKKFRAAIQLVGGVLDEAECALNEAVKCALSKRAKDAVAGVIPFIKLARKAAFPELRQARPRKGRHGRHGDLNASRNQTIAETVASIREQFRLSQEQASSVVSEALKSLVHEHRRRFRRLIKEPKADPAWIEERLKFVDKLWLSEDTVEDIAKKYRA